MKVNNKGFKMMLPRRGDRERNNIRDFRTQDENPVSRTQNRKPFDTCAICGGRGIVTSSKGADGNRETCPRCNGEGAV